MARIHMEGRRYQEVLSHLKTYFPVPISDPIMDGYFVHTISLFLDKIDRLKSTAPILESAETEGYARHPEAKIHDAMAPMEDVVDMLVDYCRGLTIWSHPNAQANVIPPPTIPSITAFIASAIYNPNIIWDEYSARFAEAEIEVVAMLSDLIGYDASRSGGIFTFGGTGTNLYACKIAIEKLLEGRGMRDGVDNNIAIVASESSHYSRLNIAGWLGIGTKNLIDIPTTRHNEMSLPHLEQRLRQCLDRGGKIAAIIATLGTTDAFGIDDIAAIVELRDQLAKEYELKYPPHVHADAVIGWVWSVFKDYDFEQNTLGFHHRTLRSLHHSTERLRHLSLADSIGIDFHKTGYAPYISSVFLLKNRRDFDCLSRAPEQMPYLYQFGQYHPGIFTLECSRSGASALAALANLRLLGKQGYRVIIGHGVEMAEHLRSRLEKAPFVKIVNDANFGPVTLFRVYPDDADAEQIFEREISDSEYGRHVEKHNAFNRRLFDLTHQRASRGDGVLLSWTDSFHHAEYPQGPPIAAIKSFIMSPWTDETAVAKVAQQINEARAQALSEMA